MTKTKQKNTTETTLVLRKRLLHATRWHFVLIITYALAIIAFDSWNLFTHQIITQRWTYGGILAVTCCLIWFSLKKYTHTRQSMTNIAYILIVADITFAALNIYTDRGMASKAVMLLVIPLLVAAQLKSRATLLATAGLSVAAYTTAAVRYFHIYYGEGLRVQLYGEVAFYSIVLFIIAALMLPLIQND